MLPYRPFSVPNGVQDVNRGIAARIRERRTMLGLTQEQTAGLVGMSREQFRRYETGLARVPADRLYLIAMALGVDVNFFFERFDTPPQFLRSRQPKEAVDLTSVQSEFDGILYIGKGRLDQLHDVSDALQRFLESLGYEVAFAEVIQGSWITRFKATISKYQDSEDVQRKVKVAEDVIYSRASASADADIVNSMAQLAGAFSEVDDVVVDAGPFLFVKVTSGCKTAVFVKRLTLEDRGILNQNPELLQNRRRSCVV